MLQTTNEDDSNLTMNDTSEVSPVPDGPYLPLYYFLISLMVLAAILILSLNLLCLIVLHLVPSIQDTTKVFLASLTIADFAFGLFTVLPTVGHYIAGDWPLGDFLCYAVGSTNYVFFGMGILSLLLLTADRYIAIVFSLRYSSIVTVTRARIVVCCTWAVGSTSLTLWDILGDPEVQKCTWKDPGEGDENYIFTLAALALILILYAHILWIARKQARRIAHDENQVGNQLGDRNRRRPISIKAANTVIIITAALLMCWIPDLVRAVLGPERIPTNVDVLCDLLLMCNSWLDVVIYYLHHSDFRRVLHRTVLSWFARFKCDSCGQQTRN